MGPIYYHRLKHMVQDKFHSRARGSCVNLTRQPGEGRSRDGGLKCGEMEKDCIVAHGMAEMQKDRMLNCSDKYDIHVCNSCGSQVIYNEKYNKCVCKICDNHNNFSKVDIPYCTKLLMQELKTIGITTRIITEQNT